MREELELEFDEMNPDPENNSDFDSDNEVNPLDTLTVSGYESKGVVSENPMKRKPV